VTPIHDHLSWCVVGVHQGEEAEVRYRLVDDAYLVEQGRRSSPTGSVDGLLPPGDIHLVRNAGPGTAISLHVYGADLHNGPSSIRRTYDLPILPIAAV
jgi:3-mercaptopropionate dioxygenase